MVDLSLHRKTPAKRVLGIDCSTNSFAWAVADSGQIESFGEIQFSGSDVFSRLADATTKVGDFARDAKLDVSLVVIESSVMVKSAAVAIKLAYVYGACLGQLVGNGIKVEEVAPITWQTYIGNPNLKKHEKDKIKADNPGHVASWYQNHGRKMRKQRTLDIVNKLHTGPPVTSDNVGDAIGVAYYASKALTRP